ncbi:cytochrome ubiquinol oxidase subunit I [Aquabacterium sp. J223]|uniref:cytochrome ubiquinol oxidase subunit I n=1 Tax=Aquabacterium sp. J223 TaxID=2898431 RepID=UPI0021AD5161|nr:cytochrome ubiquinol oxidase subunit I [Aquabacterium sp. J223]UUX95082.1 cytochrome ubiquinol oxidase subunit I [Aquabacterium sp. J223]
MDPLILSRLQFAANISFHILFPTITIALGWLLLFFRWRWLRTRDEAWLAAWRFWTKVFALSFALGVVSGITMSFQFGTNWPGFMEKVGNVAGPLLGYEVLTAFFLEATFLGVMLFGSGRVSERVHFLATFLVAFGTTMSAFWILALNSWMQTPAGHEVLNGEFFVRSWWAVIFNPSFPYRFTHMLLASFLTASFLLCGLCAWQLLKGTADAATGRVLRTGLTVAALVIPVQIFVGDLHGLNTLEHQPQKIAAMEGIWKTERGAPLLLFGWPDEAARENRFALGIPKAASLILGHSLDAEIRGLDEFEGVHPPVAPLFWGFRVMVGTGLLMLAVSWGGWWLYRRAQWRPDRLPRPLLWGLAGMTFSGWVATLAGWYVTEIGRQPFIVHGLLRTADVVTTTPAPHIALTLAGYVTLYLALIVAYVTVLKYLAEHTAEAKSQPVHSAEAVAAVAEDGADAKRPLKPAPEGR